MIQRILDIIRIKKISPAQFAEEIGIQRSSISHLVSGRNKPSLEFIQKILATYPDIRPEWLLNGKGEMFTTAQTVIQDSLIDPEKPSEPPIASETDEISLLLTEEEQPVIPLRPNAKNQVKKRPVSIEGKQVEKIVYFFKDQTYREYYPEN